jgi:hypothetical protein
MGFANLKHDEAISSHQCFYNENEDFEVMPMERQGYFQIFPLNIVLAYADNTGIGNWDGIISTNGKKIVVTRSKWIDKAKHKKVFEHSLDDIESVTSPWGNDLNVIYKNNVEGLTRSKGNYFLKFLLFFGTLLMAFFLQNYLFKGNFLLVDLDNDFKNLDKFKSMINI